MLASSIQERGKEPQSASEIVYYEPEVETINLMIADRSPTFKRPALKRSGSKTIKKVVSFDVRVCNYF
jgi:hypothetical protein